MSTRASRHPQLKQPFRKHSAISTQLSALSTQHSAKATLREWVIAQRARVRLALKLIAEYLQSD